MCKIVGVPYSCCKKKKSCIASNIAFLSLSAILFKVNEVYFIFYRFKCNTGCLVLLRYVSYFYYCLK